MKSQARNEEWFLIIAKDKSCQGYIPAKDKEEACERFGMRVEQCSIKRVEWSGKGFVEPNQAKQEKLL